jgi:hypothetical protein
MTGISSLNIDDCCRKNGGFNRKNKTRELCLSTMVRGFVVFWLMIQGADVLADALADGLTDGLSTTPSPAPGTTFGSILSSLLQAVAANSSTTLIVAVNSSLTHFFLVALDSIVEVPFLMCKFFVAES